LAFNLYFSTRKFIFGPLYTFTEKEMGSDKGENGSIKTKMINSKFSITLLRAKLFYGRIIQLRALENQGFWSGSRQEKFQNSSPDRMG